MYIRVMFYVNELGRQEPLIPNENNFVPSINKIPKQETIEYESALSKFFQFICLCA